MYFDLIFPVVLILVMLASGLVVGRLMASSYLGPEVAKKVVGHRRVLVFLVVAAVLALWFGLDHLPASVREIAPRALLLVTSGLMLLSVVVIRYWRRRLGPVIVKLPANSYNKIWIALGIGLCVWTIIGVFVLGTPGGVAGENARFLLPYFGFGLAMALIGLNRFTIHAGGVSGLDNVIPWKRVHSYSWEDTNRSILKLRYKRRIPGYKYGWLGIPEGQRAAVEKVLTDNLGPPSG